MRRPDRDQDLAAGRRLGHARGGLGADRRAAIFESVWMNDHLTDIGLDRRRRELGGGDGDGGPRPPRPGPLARPRGPVGDLPPLRRCTAKAATVLDHVTGGRFILGLGAGWFEPEHTPFGIPFPPMPERFDRFESAVRTIKALLSDEAATTTAGVTRDDPFFPLVGATNDPPPVRAGRSARSGWAARSGAGSRSLRRSPTVGSCRPSCPTSPRRT